VKIKQDILNTIDATSQDALDFLNQKQNDVKKQEGILLKTETAIVKNIDNDGMTDTQRETIESLKKALHDVEFNEADIMREQLFMTQLMQDIQKALGTYNMPYIDAKNKLQSEHEKYVNFSGVLEERFNAIQDENEDKQSLRQKIVHNENKLSQAKEKYESFTKDFAPIYSSIQEREEKKGITEKAKQDLIEKLESLHKKVADLESKLQESHENNVHLSLALEQAEKEQKEAEEINALFQTNNLTLDDKRNEVEEIKEGIANTRDEDCESELAQVNTEIVNLENQIKDKDIEIATLEAESNWLLQQNVAQGVEINDLKGKLRVWESNYNSFKALVKDLAEYVGYPIGDKMLNANGDTAENPLVPLISQLQDITEWVKDQEQIPPEPDTEEVIVEVEKEHSHLPYIIGGALLTALALTMKK